MNSRIYPSVTVRPADEERYRGRLREIRIQHPIDDERGVLVRCVFRTDDERTEKVSSVFIGSHNNRG